MILNILGLDGVPLKHLKGTFPGEETRPTNAHNKTFLLPKKQKQNPFTLQSAWLDHHKHMPH